MDIRLSKEEIANIILEKMDCKGQIRFIIEEETKQHGSLDGVAQYHKAKIFKGIEIKNYMKNE